MTLSRAYLGTTTPGAAGLVMVASRSYLKRRTIPAGSVLASIDAHLRTANGSGVALRPVLHANNGADPGSLIGYQGSFTDAVAFNGRDDWTSLPMLYPFAADTDVWFGLHSSDPTGLELSHETTGGTGLDKRITSLGATFTSEVGGASATLADDSHIYSIRAQIISGFSGFSTVGRTSIGASWLAMGAGTVYIRKVTIPADRLLLGIRAHVRHHTLNGHNLAAYLWADSGGSPSTLLFPGPQAAGMFLAQDVGRDLHFPVGRAFEATTDVWIGISASNSGAFELAFDASGADGGTLASPSDAALYTAGDDDYSLHAALAA